MIEFFDKITEGIEKGTLTEIDLGELTPKQIEEIHKWAEMVLNTPEGVYNVDVLLAMTYLKRALDFLKGAVELLMPYGEQSYRPKVKLVLEEVGKDLHVPPLSSQVFAVAAKQVNEIDLYSRGLKSFLSLGMLRRITEAG
jgi:hypothetical protein